MQLQKAQVNSVCGVRSWWLHIAGDHYTLAPVKLLDDAQSCVMRLYRNTVKARNIRPPRFVKPQTPTLIICMFHGIYVLCILLWMSLAGAESRKLSSDNYVCISVGIYWLIGCFLWTMQVCHLLMKSKRIPMTTFLFHGIWASRSSIPAFPTTSQQTANIRPKFVTRYLVSNIDHVSCESNQCFHLLTV